MVNAVTGTMVIAIHLEAWDYSVGKVCTVTVDMDMATVTEAAMVVIILPMVISMGDMVVILKDILIHTHNTKHTANLKRISNHQPLVNHKPIVNHQPMVKLKVI